MGHGGSASTPRLEDAGIYASYVGATLTAKAFDTVVPGMGRWLVTSQSGSSPSPP